ncbi:MAG: ThuA domain-containing protein [Victivallales bacterium]|jgi:trehalose utilization protein|nr:ThuA domain-containing protein [Victivallales bacterium]
MNKIKVTIWNEFRHEKQMEEVRKIYPEGIHGAIAQGIAADDLEIRLAALDDPEQGLPDEVIASTDVLIWWGHCAHGEVRDELVAKVLKRVQEGMGLIVLHSGHASKIFKAVTGCSGALKWREAEEKERLWNIAPTHPITQGIDEYFELPHEEMYGERFDIPKTAETIFISWFEGGNVFRSGFTLERGYGKFFYFQPGHETYRNFYDKNVLKVIGNAVRWAKPVFLREMAFPMVPALEEIRSTGFGAPKAGIIQNIDGSNK